MNDEPGDRSLVQAVTRHGDERAFRVLYRRHTPRLNRVVHGLTAAGPMECDDLVQETWVRAVASLGQFEWRSSLGTWLTGILVNRIREVARQEGGEVPLPEDVTAMWPPAPVIADPIDLERAIGALPPRAREVLLLHDVEGYTHEEIARLLDIEPGTSKSQLSRARRAVVHFLNPSPEGSRHAQSS